jgi:hypothetical protein
MKHAHVYGLTYSGTESNVVALPVFFWRRLKRQKAIPNAMAAPIMAVAIAIPATAPGDTPLDELLAIAAGAEVALPA